MIRKIFLAILVVCLVAPVVFSKDKEWEVKKSTHFIVYYKEAPKEFIENIIESAEDYYHSISSELGLRRKDYWLWDDRAKIYIHSNKDEYVKASGQPHWSSGSALYELKTIHTYPLASGFFDTLLPHELGHIIFREFIGFRRDIPIWLDEGIAMYQEKARRWGSNDVVKKAIKDGSFIPLDELSKMRLWSGLGDETITLFYAESTSVVYFLLQEYGRHSFIKFCRELRDGKELEEAFDDAYVRFDTFEELNTAWVRYLENE